ncbi:MAG: T9SS type A sorting domain-containing protein [Ignavibacteriae bacterium]|nr:T9SS type A sorting domain-containing protein [Ignavibacteriota bacterium]
MRSSLRFLLIAAMNVVFTAAALPQTSLWDRVPDALKERNAFKRFEWFYRQRAYPYDTIPVEHFYRERSKELAKQADASQLAVSWSPIGPRGISSIWPPAWGELSGRVRGVAVHPTDPNIAYIGAAAGGLWKTTNGGTSWSVLSEAFAINTFGAIAIDPNNPNVVYAGTGEVMASFNLQNLDGRGLYKSTNGGATWTQITNGFGAQTHFGMIAVNPNNSNIVIACLGSGYSFIGSLQNEGVWRSTDAGTTWGKVINVDNAFDVVFHPTIAGKVYAAAGNGAGVFVSTDHGATWTTANNGLSLASLSRIQIAIANSAPSTMYAYIFNGTETRVYKTTDGAASWSQISVGVRLSGTYDGTNWVDQAWYDATIAVKPNDPNFVLTGNVEIHRTTNGADFSPLRLTSGPFGGTRAWDCPTHTDIHRIVYSVSNPNVAYLGCDGGIYKSTDGGNTFASVNAAISTIQFYRIASHPTNRNFIIGGAQDNGNYKTSDAGATPWALTTTGDGMECLIDYASPNVVFMSTQNGNILRSLSGGDYGTYSNARPSWETTPNWTTPLIIHPTDHNTLYTASRRIWRSTNQGSSWTSLTGTIASSDVINGLAQGRTNPNIMIASASGYSNSNPQVLVSTDGGFNWTDVALKIPGGTRYVSRVVVHPLDHNTLFVVRSGFGSGKLYMSNDLGQTWTNMTGDLADVPASDFFVDPQRPRHWYIANDLGVYLSTNRGLNWSRQSSGISIVPGLDFDYFANAGTRLLRLGTHGRSAYEAPLSLDSVPSIFASPLAKSFAKLEANASGDTTVATIYNFGTQSLTVSSITKGNASFTLVNLPSLPAIIPAQGSVQFKIVFRPTVHGAVTDSVRIASNDPNYSVTYIPLSGSGVVVGTARPGVMYAVSGTSLYTINTTSGAATVVGPLGVTQVDAITVRPSTRELYGIYTTGLNTQLYRISDQHGDALPLRIVPLGNVRSIAFGSDGTCFAATSAGSLYRINLTTGDTTFVGSSGLAYAGLSFSPLAGGLWASVRPPLTNRDRIYKLNTTTGAATLVGATGDNAVTPSIAFNPLGVLYGLKGTSSQTNTLIRIDTTTGVGTTIGSMGVSGIVSIAMRTDSLATGVEETESGEPAAFALHQNYPNPFNPATTIKFSIPAGAGHAPSLLKVYDVLGREVATLVNEVKPAGTYTVQWDAKELSSGVYFCRLQSGGMTSVRRLLLLR